ncbi:MAG: DNA polymerase I [Candidatus Buchananbacteria bacterium RIFCSPHIGHO2_01_FULL_39_8]|uniref:DNA polymerase I n=1 Tax=Candidatus Buchananbacteria bacterium RIFCSPHIGHO2_01_FULL_39_8 TaxID=1797533 RepID=A0A1G1XTL4_9BACT|nr:MAG: DNA polymerase I [Candidatus Buchananbacteria bacterium RIFCSPHIGHO2_01_FULL_39_8]
MVAKKEKFIIIDGNALIHRAWHALPPTLTTKSGEIVNAVYGFTMTLLKVLKDLKPDYLAVTFDLAGPTFRHQEYKEYKATRVKQADELYAQIPRIKEVVKTFNIPIYEKSNFEADDVIATLVKDKQVEKINSVIVTGDLDTLQLVDENTEVYTMHKGISDTITYNIAAVKRRFEGLMPYQMVDYKALRGDPSDNVPGVKGIGEKGAINLLKEFKTLENIYKNIDSPKITDRYRNLLQEHKKEATMSKKLCQLINDVPIKFKLTEAKVKGFDAAEVVALFQELEFKSLINKLPKELQHGTMPGQTTLDFGTHQVRAKSQNVKYELIDNDDKFEKFLAQLKKQKIFAIDTETSSIDPFNSKLLGVSFCWKDGGAFYLPAAEPWLEQIKPTLENDQIKKVGHNIKFDLESLRTAGINLKGISFDTMVASYLINPGSRQHNLDGLVFTELGYQMQPITDLIGKGKNQISLEQVPIQQVSDYSCEDADFTWRLVKPLTEQLKKNNNLGLLEKIEVPLISVLAEMESNGVIIDTTFLSQMGKEVGKKLEEIETKIFKLAGTKFNVASPIQLKEILFDRLKISTQGLGKTKTGISTAASELEKLKGTHKIIDYIIEFRELAKLKSTYLDALPKLVNPLDGRVHTSFNQTVAATGRLSSSDPNLQNIPIRTELGQQIRKAFIAPSGYKILSADYSQIELRIIASLANDKRMIESFKKGEDIHTRTAAEINEIPLDKVTKEMRYAAKAINFGIIYGQGAWGLSEYAGISRERAEEFIDRYFLIHQSIQKFLEETKKLSHEKGFVETWFGRRRYLPEINSSIQPIRAGAERMAVNHPIQGTAADLMKLAMIAIQQSLGKISLETKLILQVHDELVFEVPEKDIKKVAKFVEKSMEDVYELRAPVETHIEAGNSWGTLKSIN